MHKRGLLMTVLMVSVLLVGAGATVALTGESSNEKNAAKHQYGGPNGCGPKHRGHERPCKPKCKKAKKGNKKGNKKGGRKGGRNRGGKCRVKGTHGNDRMRGTRRRDRVTGGRGNDVIDVRGGGRDRVRCGPGDDTVYVDRRDRVARDCENVKGGRGRGPK